MVRPAPQPPCAHPSSRRRPRPTSPSLTTGCAIASNRRWSATPSSAFAATPFATFVAAAPFARLTGHGRGTVACCPGAEHPRSGARRPPPARGMLHSYSPKRNRADERRREARRSTTLSPRRIGRSGKDERGRVPIGCPSCGSARAPQIRTRGVFSRPRLLAHELAQTSKHLDFTSCAPTLTRPSPCEDRQARGEVRPSSLEE